MCDVTRILWKVFKEKKKTCRVEGELPEGRVGHRFVAVGDKLYLIGGGVWSEKNGWSVQYYQMYVYDTVEKRWYLPNSERSSSGRSDNTKDTNSSKGLPSNNSGDAMEEDENGSGGSLRSSNGSNSRNEPVNATSVMPHPPPVCYPFSFAYKEFLVTTTLAEKKMWLFDTISEIWHEVPMSGDVADTDIPTSAHSMGAVGVVDNQAFFLGSYHIGPGSSLNDFYRVTFEF